MTAARTVIRSVAVLLLAGAVLAACGKKPQFVDPPQGKAADSFPQTYPNPALDPKPGQAQSGTAQPGQAPSAQAQPGQAMPGEIIPGWKFP